MQLSTQRGFAPLASIITLAILITGIVVILKLSNKPLDLRTRGSGAESCTGSLEFICPDVTDLAKINQVCDANSRGDQSPSIDPSQKGKLKIKWNMPSGNCQAYLSAAGDTSVVSTACQGELVFDDRIKFDRSTQNGNLVCPKDVYELVLDNSQDNCRSHTAAKIDLNGVFEKCAQGRGGTTGQSFPPPQLTTSPDPEESAETLQKKIDKEFNITMLGFDQQRLKWAFEKLSETKNSSLSRMTTDLIIQSSNTDVNEIPINCKQPIVIAQKDDQNRFEYALMHGIGHFIFECKSLDLSKRLPDHKNVFDNEGAISAYSYCQNNPDVSSQEDYADMVAYYFNSDASQLTPTLESCSFDNKPFADKKNPFSDKNRFPQHYELVKKIFDRFLSTPVPNNAPVTPPAPGGSGS